jgi:hypothetical protein
MRRRRALSLTVPGGKIFSTNVRFNRNHFPFCISSFPALLLFILLWNAAASAQPVPGATSGTAQGTTPGATPRQPAAPPQAPSPGAPANPAAPGQPGEFDTSEQPPASDWAPALLYAIINAPNTAALESLYDAAFAAGPDLVPQLITALPDDRTAVFAAQALAFVANDAAMKQLALLVHDPRDLDLRRFYYGTLGEFRDPRATDQLVQAIARSDQEPDRTVSEAAIQALTVRSDPALVQPLRQAITRITDPVVRDDVEVAIQAIQARAAFMATPQGRNAGGSIEEALHTYFIPALGAAAAAAHQAAARAGASGRLATPPPPAPRIIVGHIQMNPDKTRALTHVIFDTPEVEAHYDLVLQKEFGDWVVASVWLRTANEKQPPAPRKKP